MALRVRRVVTRAFEENSYLLVCTETGEAVFVDPGDDAPALEALAAREQARPVAIWNTHAHIDHMGAVAPLQQRYGIPFRVGAGERGWVQALALQARMFGLAVPETPRIDATFADGDELSFGRVRGRAIATPGHTEGGFCFHFPDDRVLLTGDTLFVGSVGRTDLPGGSMEALEQSIREKLFTLPDETVFHSGHGPEGRIGEERRSNPFVGENAGF